jgi:hypothetical protein
VVRPIGSRKTNPQKEVLLHQVGVVNPTTTANAQRPDCKINKNATAAWPMLASREPENFWWGTLGIGAIARRPEVERNFQQRRGGVT